MARRSVRACWLILIAVQVIPVLPQPAVAQARAGSEGNPLLQHLGKPAILVIRSGWPVRFEGRERAGTLEARVSGVRGDSLLIRPRNGEVETAVPFGAIRTLRVGTKRSPSDGVIHAALNGAAVGATLGLVDQLIRSAGTDVNGDKINPLTVGNVSGSMLAGAFLFALPGAAIGAIHPGTSWGDVGLTTGRVEGATVFSLSIILARW